jgi:hypothetical protein
MFVVLCPDLGRVASGSWIIVTAINFQFRFQKGSSSSLQGICLQFSTHWLLGCKLNDPTSHWISMRLALQTMLTEKALTLWAVTSCKWSFGSQQDITSKCRYRSWHTWYLRLLDVSIWSKNLVGGRGSNHQAIKIWNDLTWIACLSWMPANYDFLILRSISSQRSFKKTLIASYFKGEQIDSVEYSNVGFNPRFLKDSSCFQAEI